MSSITRDDVTRWGRAFSVSANDIGVLLLNQLRGVTLTFAMLATRTRLPVLNRAPTRPLEILATLCRADIDAADRSLVLRVGAVLNMLAEAGHARVLPAHIREHCT